MTMLVARACATPLQFASVDYCLNVILYKIEILESCIGYHGGGGKLAGSLREAVLLEVGHEGGVWCVGRALIKFSKGFLAVRRRGSFLALQK
tara:strand:- start:12994 stop:13269 length:276 start_codon:yes stop_codon:yes gene_type:complete